MTEVEAKRLLEKLRAAEVASLRAEAKLDAAEDELRRLGFDSVEAAEAHVRKKRKKKLRLSTELAAALKDFEQKYWDLLNDQ